MTKEQIAELEAIIQQIPEDRQAIGRNLAQEIVFLAETLDDLKQQIRNHGTLTEFKNGKQEFLRENPACKLYVATIARYSTLYRQLTDLLPKTAAVPPENELLEFIK